jgi:hypothetical protein
MTPRSAYYRAGRAVALAARDEMPNLPTVISGIAAMLCGSIAASEYRWRRGGTFRPVPKWLKDHVADFVQIYSGDPRAIAQGECLAIGICGDFWREISELAERLQRGEQIAMSAVRQLVARRLSGTELFKYESRL